MKSIKIIVISFLCMLLLTTNIFAAPKDDFVMVTPGGGAGTSEIEGGARPGKDTSQIGETLETGKDWLEDGKGNATGTMDSEQLAEGSSKLYYMLLAVATAVALVAGVMLGIKYMTAGVEEKVQVKESLLPYVVSCIIVFGSLGIWRLMVSILGNL